MSDVTQMTDEALVNAFTDSVMEVRCDGTGGDPSPIQRLQYQEQHTELLRRLALGRALQSAAGEGPLIPLADAVRVVEEFFWPDDRTGQRAIAALQALGGGE